METFHNAMIARLLPIYDKSLIKSPLDASAHPREPVAGDPCFQTGKLSGDVFLQCDELTNGRVFS